MSRYVLPLAFASPMWLIGSSMWFWPKPPVAFIAVDYGVGVLFTIFVFGVWSRL